jgi:hypothetical protein
MLQYLEHSIDANKREDHLYHSYNLIEIGPKKGTSVDYLSVMLEGQVAVLSSGYLSPENVLSLLDNLKQSALYRKDQYSYILYPNKELPRFMDKNVIPASAIKSSSLLTQLVKDDNRQIIERDVEGAYHFNGNFNNAKDLKYALEALETKSNSKLINKEKELILNIFEDVFDHKSFTGRSGTFFGYEGLGSIYWHMVSKLLLAVMECCKSAIEQGANKEVVQGLIAHYHEINEGIGVHKSPELYGAFPTDPYSHTPASKGAQQPGMTGQVKEDILSRMAELGVEVREGKLSFGVGLLQKEEILKENQEFVYIDLHQEEQSISLAPGSLAFTYCQTPVIYTFGAKKGAEILFKDRSVKNQDEVVLDPETSAKIFRRTGEINMIKVFLPLDEVPM